MRAIAWDDEPEYMESLEPHLKSYGIALTVFANPDEFVKAYKEGAPWDLVITDLVHANHPSVGQKNPEVGVQIAKRLATKLPVIILTAHEKLVDREALGIPDGVPIKYKTTMSGWMADDIYNELVLRGDYVDSSKVFLIYGHDWEADGTTQAVTNFLEKRHIEVEAIGDGTLNSELAEGLLKRMRDCAAIIAVCTPDDLVEKGDKGQFYQPRQNVLLEIGMAMGLAGGLNRLTILQKWGPSLKDQARLPSDLGGVLTERFVGNVEHLFAKLERRLKALRVDIREPT